MLRFIKSLYINQRFYIFLAVCIVMFVFSQFFTILYAISEFGVLLLFGVLLIDILMLYGAGSEGIEAQRTHTQRLSNGDDNPVQLTIKNNSKQAVNINVVDEIPLQFQIRNFNIEAFLPAGKQKIFNYTLRPVERGVYNFGTINIYTSTSIGLISRRFTFKNSTDVPVYPSFIQMRKYELMAISNRLSEMGIKKVRRISNNQEFEQIRDYVNGDDIRTINWKATARKAQLMVNQYQDEKSQQVINVIDMGRNMKMPFEKMTLLDYAINASLVISNISMYKHDKAGLITFNDKIETIIPASRNGIQMQKLMEALYQQSTNFAEANYEMLYIAIKNTLKQRSLILLYTNFESLVNLKRNLRFFSRLAKSHLVVVVFFENTEIKQLIGAENQNNDNKPQRSARIINNNKTTIEDIYIETIAEKFSFEKRQIVKELQKHGIYSILTEPKNLTVNTINKYLELKSRGII